MSKLDTTKIFQVNQSNYSKYNFTMTLENQLKFNLQKGNHEANYNLLHEHFQQLINTIKVFGDDKTAQKLLNKFVHTVEFFAMNYHKSKDFYSVMTEFGQYSHNPWPSTEFGINICIKLLEVVRSQKGCFHGCCV